MEIAHDFGFAVQAPVGIHEEEAGEEVGGGALVVVAAAGWRGNGLEADGCYIKR